MYRLNQIELMVSAAPAGNYFSAARTISLRQQVCMAMDINDPPDIAAGARRPSPVVAGIGAAPWPARAHEEQRELNYLLDRGILDAYQRLTSARRDGNYAHIVQWRTRMDELLDERRPLPRQPR